jgi:ElaB/YqjD/DUF883 family membrane-anchored ribosome-binding protein
MAMTDIDAQGVLRRRVRAHRDGDTVQLQALVDEGRALLNASADPSAYELDRSFTELRGRFIALQSAATQFADLLGGQGQQILRVADDHVRARPWSATAQALALGFVVGWLVGERRS